MLHINDMSEGRSWSEVFALIISIPSWGKHPSFLCFILTCLNLLSLTKMIPIIIIFFTSLRGSCCGMGKCSCIHVECALCVIRSAYFCSWYPIGLEWLFTFLFFHFLLCYSLGNVLFTKLFWYILPFMIVPNVFFYFSTVSVMRGVLEMDKWQLGSHFFSKAWDYFDVAAGCCISWGIA